MKEADVINEGTPARQRMPTQGKRYAGTSTRPDGAEALAEEARAVTFHASLRFGSSVLDQHKELP